MYLDKTIRIYHLALQEDLRSSSRLTSSNFLVDRGIATAAEFGVFGPEGEWLIEGHGVEPDIVVDNLPHATFEGRDAQLEAAIDLLLGRIKEDPVVDPVVPAHPDLSSDD